MTAEPDDPQEVGRRRRPTVDVPRSVLTVLAGRSGEVPRLSLVDEDAAAGGVPPVDVHSDERDALPEGRGTYQVQGELARGGMGVVLRAHDTDLGRDVAMKVLSKKLADRPDVVRRFVEEAQIGGQLQHPGIVPVYELGLMADERPYFTMKLVKGQTLARLFAEREDARADRRRLLDVFLSICRTLAYAHSRGVIHRDLKPANIMVGAFGEVQVVDWGLAKVLAREGVVAEGGERGEPTVLETVRSDGSSTGSESRVGSVLGTPAYMPPEQASGQVDRLDELRVQVVALQADGRHADASRLAANALVLVEGRAGDLLAARANDLVAGSVEISSTTCQDSGVGEAPWKIGTCSVGMGAMNSIAVCGRHWAMRMRSRTAWASVAATTDTNAPSNAALRVSAFMGTSSGDLPNGTGRG